LQIAPPILQNALRFSKRFKALEICQPLADELQRMIQSMSRR
jgi:hypothetical protein